MSLRESSESGMRGTVDMRRDLRSSCVIWCMILRNEFAKPCDSQLASKE